MICMGRMLSEKKEPLFSTVFREERRLAYGSVSCPKAGFRRGNRLLLIRKS